MKTKDRILDFTNQDIFIGLDVHKKSWKATFSTAHTIQKTIHIEKPLVRNLNRYLTTHYPNGQYHCAYEAGFSGFWIQEQLQKLGIQTIIAHAADIPTSDKERQFKNDQRDSRKISMTLRSGELNGIYVPSKIAQRDRSIVRERASIANSQRRVKNQIKSQLLFYGIDIPEDFASRYWSLRFVDWLVKMSEQKNDKALKIKIKRHLLLRELQLMATRELRKLSKTPRHSQLSKILRTVPGVGLLTMMLLITEIIDITRFKTMDQLFSYVGLIPRTHSSGEKEQIGEMTKRGNRRLKVALVESSWVAIRRDGELLAKYEKLRARMGSNKAIVRIAKILLRRIRRVWIQKQEYRIAEI